MLWSSVISYSLQPFLWIRVGYFSSIFCLFTCLFLSSDRILWVSIASISSSPLLLQLSMVSCHWYMFCITQTLFLQGVKAILQTCNLQGCLKEGFHKLNFRWWIPSNTLKTVIWILNTQHLACLSVPTTGKKNNFFCLFVLKQSVKASFFERSQMDKLRSCLSRQYFRFTQFCSLI